MARVRTPYWLPGSVRNWLICNFLCVGVFELGFCLAGVPWLRRFPVTILLGGALVVWAVLHFLGRTALLEYEDRVSWRPARLTEPGEPPPGNRLAWPAPGDAAPRVATPAARALTVRKRHSPRDRGKGSEMLIGIPALGFLAAALSSILMLAFNSRVVWVIWILWGASVWVCITTAIVLKTRRLNEDA